MEVKNRIVYKNGDLMFFYDFSEAKSSDVYLSGIYVAGLVLEGTLSLKINDTEQEIHKNDLFICQPTNVLEHMKSSADLRCDCILMNHKYANKVFPLSRSSDAWEFKKVVERAPVFTLLPKEVEIYCKFFDLFCTKTDLPAADQEELIDALMLAFTYYMNHVGRRFVKPVARPYTSGEGHFRKFIELLESSSPKNRSLGYYAELLHVTPKYLSGICKKLTGQTASRLIAVYVTKDIEYMLKFSQKSIKEVAYEMDFPTLSFFGRYVKKHLGMSPKEFREEYRKKIRG